MSFKSRSFIIKIHDVKPVSFYMETQNKLYIAACLCLTASCNICVHILHINVIAVTSQSYRAAACWLLPHTHAQLIFYSPEMSLSRSVNILVNTGDSEKCQGFCTCVHSGRLSHAQTLTVYWYIYCKKLWEICTITFHNPTSVFVTVFFLSHKATCCCSPTCG